MNRQSYNDPGHAHFLTFTCYRRQQLLTDDRIKSWLVQSIDKARESHRFKLWAWVIMPDHVHLLIHPVMAEYSIGQIMQAIKGPFAHRVIDEWRKNDPKRLESVSLIANGEVTYRFWQAGGGFDRNIYQMDRVRKAVEYIEHNPARRGLVSESSEWLWSSAYSWAGKGDTPLTADSIEFESKVYSTRLETRSRAPGHSNLSI